MITDATRECFASLTKMVERDGKGGRWLVLTHDNPDPDALASAQILARILRQRFKQRVTVAYGGIVGRAENRELVKSLRLPFSHVRHLSWKKYQHFALVDTQPRSGNNQLPPRTVPDIVIDHHPVRANTQAGTAEIWQAAAPENSQIFMLFGVAVLIPLILIYTGWAYWVFRGKVRPESGYH